jgi:MSHA biogenesis protein MshL
LKNQISENHPMDDFQRAQTEKDFMRTTTILDISSKLLHMVFLCCLILAILIIQPQSQAVQQPQAESSNVSSNQEKDKSLFALSFKDVSLRELLLLLTKESKYSLIMEPGIDIVIPALTLKSVSMEEALDSILPGLGLQYRFEGNLLRVGRPPMQTRMFYMNYIAVSRSGKRDMQMSSRSKSGGSGGGGGGSSSGSGGGGGGGGGSAGGSSSENESSIVTTNSSEVWADLLLGLESIIFPSGNSQGPGAKGELSAPGAMSTRDAAGHRLLINPQAGLIMVRAEPAALAEVANYIEAVEGSIQRQVLIEAKIIEVTLSKDYQLGVNWSTILNPTSHFSGLLSGAHGVSSPSLNLSTGAVLNQNLNPSLGHVQYAISNGKVGMVVDALSRQGQLRVLSSPHISTLNNQKAVIRVVREEVFFTQSSSVSQSLSTVTTQNVENQIVPIGVVLDIIPQISYDGEITLSINPSISELVEVRTFESGSGDSISTQPVIDRRDLDTVAKVHSGETVLIAGIMRERKSEDLRGIPWLMNIPFLGNAFRRTEQSSTRTELVILITPTLISGTAVEDLTEEKIQQLHKLEQPFKLGTVETKQESGARSQKSEEKQ